MESIMDDTPSNAFGVKRWSLGIIADTLFPRRATQQLKRSWEQRSRQYIELKEVDTDSHTVCVTLEFSIHFLRFKIDTNDGIIFIPSKPVRPRTSGRGYTGLIYFFC